MTTPTDPSETPTQPAMQAVRPSSPAVEVVDDAPRSWHGPVAELHDRLGRLEDSHRQLRSSWREHREEEVLVRGHTDQRLGSVEYDVGELKTNVTAIKSEMGTQSTKLDAHTSALADLKTASEKRTETLDRIEGLLKPFGSVFAHPRVQTALVALTLTAIAALTAWLTSKGHVAP